MTSLIQSCADLFVDTFNASCGVEVLRLLAIFLLYRAALAVFLMISHGVRRL